MHDYIVKITDHRTTWEEKIQADSYSVKDNWLDFYTVRTAVSGTEKDSWDRPVQEKASTKVFSLKEHTVLYVKKI